tara:strand:+ start:628 stop:813 length:186 start_codon:yes stop_codon:yes gene_type:complete
MEVKDQTLTFTEKCEVRHALQDYNSKLEGDVKMFSNAGLIKLYKNKINKIESLISKIESTL